MGSNPYPRTVPETQPWTSPVSKSSCWPRWYDASCRTGFQCISRSGCCCHSWWSWRFRGPEIQSFQVNCLYGWVFDYYLPKNVLRYLHDGAGSQDSFLHISFAKGAADSGKVTHGVLSRDSLASAGLSTHNDGLVPLVSVKPLMKNNDPKKKKKLTASQIKKKLYLKCEQNKDQTLPCVCMLPLQQQIYGGPCPPCSAHDRH